LSIRIYAVDLDDWGTLCQISRDNDRNSLKLSDLLNLMSSRRCPQAFKPVWIKLFSQGMQGLQLSFLGEEFLDLVLFRGFSGRLAVRSLGRDIGLLSKQELDDFDMSFVDSS